MADLLVLLVLAFAVCLSIVAFRSLPWHWVLKTAMLGTIAVFVIFGFAFCSGEFRTPNARGAFNYVATLSMISNRADRYSFERWFRSIGANWHRGEAWKPDAALSAPALPCKNDCGTELQVAFPIAADGCGVAGERLTLKFDASNHLKSWSHSPARDKC
jgi:hypothetical protein